MRKKINYEKNLFRWKNIKIKMILFHSYIWNEIISAKCKTN